MTNWQYHPPGGTFDLLIIGSLGEASDCQTIQVAHKRIPSNQEGSNQWITKEIELIRGMYENDHSCHRVIICSEANLTKDYYLEEIKKFFIDCKETGGKIH